MAALLYLGAAKTSAYYAVAPFVGALLSFAFLKEDFSWIYLAALAVMIAGAALVVIDNARCRIRPVGGKDIQL